MLMMTRKTIVMAAAAIALSAGCGHAQMNMKDMKPESKPMAMAGDAAGQSFDGLLAMMEKEIMDNAGAMPADKYDFAPSQAIFKDSQKTDFTTPKPVMSYGAMLKHIANANYYFFASRTNKPPATVSVKDARTKEQIIAALKESFAFAHKSVSGMTVADGFEAADSEGHKTTQAAAYAFGLMHMNDHYGQLNEYLRMNGIVPPASRK